MKMPRDLMVDQLETTEMPLPKGVEQKIEENDHCTVTEVTVRDEEGARFLGRERGIYITIETEKTYEIGEPAFEEIAGELAERLKKLIGGRQRLLVLGIGNPEITPDSLGSKAIHRLMVTRPLEERPQGWREIAAMESPVFGISGVESRELAKGLVEAIKPEAVILIDALATGRLERLCKTIQLADCGLIPGGGVENARQEISRRTLGVPVISIGMPTVVDCRALLRYVLGEEGEAYEEKLHPYEESLLATPRQMGLATDMAARIIAFALNKAFHGDLSTEDILKFLY